MAMPPPNEPRSPQPPGSPGPAAAPQRLREVPPTWLPCLEVVEGDATARSVPLGAGPVRIGRAPSNELVLADDKASRTHAQVVRDGWEYAIEDLHSTNGVTVNGAKVERAVLAPGSRIGIGRTSIVFRQPAPDVPRDARRSLFASNELLQSLAAETCSEIADRLPARVVPAGTVVVRAGQPLSGMLLVYLGRFRLVSINDAGAERVVAHFGSGASFGESALIGGRNADHTLIAEEHACVFELPKSELTGLLAKKPAEGRRVVETVLGMMLPTARPRTEAGPVRPGIPAPAPVAAATVIIGNDPKIARAKKATETLAKDDKPILVVGPTGSGKKTFARHFHRSGAHASAGYNELSIAGMDPARILPAIVGTEGGAAAGGGAGDMGLLELMGSGTLAICHAERLDAHQQHVLADYAQTGWFHRDRGRTAVQSRVRIVFVATGAEQEVLAGLAPSLRALLEGRVVSLPALAQRAKDIQPLAEHFLQLHSVKAGKRGLTLPREAVDRLVPYAWPGNVSELEFVMQRAAILAPDGSEVSAGLIFVVPPEEETLKINLLRDEKVRATLRNPWLVPALTWICMGFIALVVFLTLRGALAPEGDPLAVTETNPAMMVTWFIWFPILPLVTASVGRVWCAVCPIAGFGDLFAKLGRFNLPAPRLLKRLDFWTLIAAYILIEFGEGLFGVDSSPGMTLAFLAGLLFVAALMTVLYERRAFCRYLCPLAGWLGAYSALSPLEIRGNKKVCQTQCGEHSCYKGTEAVPGCPMFLYPAAMNSNTECLLCTNCVKSCENRGVQLNLRPPLVELWRNAAPSIALSVFAFVLLGVMYLALDHEAAVLEGVEDGAAPAAHVPRAVALLRLHHRRRDLPDGGLDAVGGGIARETVGEHGALRGSVHPARVRVARVADDQGAAEHRPDDDVGLGQRSRLHVCCGRAAGRSLRSCRRILRPGTDDSRRPGGERHRDRLRREARGQVGRHGAGAATPADGSRPRLRPDVHSARACGEAGNPGRDVGSGGDHPAGRSSGHACQAGCATAREVRTRNHSGSDF